VKLLGQNPQPQDVGMTKKEEMWHYLSDLILLTSIFLFFLVSFIFCAFVIKRKVVIRSGSQIVGESIQMAFSTKDKRQAAEYVTFQKEEDEIRNSEADDISRFLRNKKEEKR